MGSSRYVHLVGWLLTAGALLGCASQQPCGGTSCSADAKTTAAVTSRLKSHSELGAPGQIQVETIDHVVYLTGIVDTGFQEETAESLAAGTPGVAKVVSTIGVSK
jgi:osmotically-inducible protein OsmY